MRGIVEILQDREWLGEAGIDHDAVAPNPRTWRQRLDARLAEQDERIAQLDERLLDLELKRPW